MRLLPKAPMQAMSQPNFTPAPSGQKQRRIGALERRPANWPPWLTASIVDILILRSGCVAVNYGRSLSKWSFLVCGAFFRTRARVPSHAAFGHRALRTWHSRSWPPRHSKQCPRPATSRYQAGSILDRLSCHFDGALISGVVRVLFHNASRSVAPVVSSTPWRTGK
jgi:hypothetical protein